MKKYMLIACAAAAIAMTPAVAQTNLLEGEATEAPEAVSTAPVEILPEESTALADLGSAEQPANDNWDSLDDTTRYLSIMGTADGFSAGGAGSPCFPGKDNAKLDVELKAAGFGSKSLDELAGELAKLSAPASECSSIPQRGYNSELLKSMPDAHLATYLTAAVRGFATTKTCAPSDHGFAAATIAAEIFATQDAKAPHDLISGALANGCEQPKP